MQSPTLLCIDDHAQLLELRKASLEPLGYSVYTVTSVSTAISLLERMPVAAVLLDFKCEGMDAEAVAFHIKQRFPNQPIILLSAYSDMPEPILWLVDEFVWKGQPVERLAEVIERISHGTSEEARNPTEDRADVWRHQTAA